MQIYYASYNLGLNFQKVGLTQKRRLDYIPKVFCDLT
jgi:hypothetical protein